MVKTPYSAKRTPCVLLRKETTMNEAGNCVPARSARPPQYTWATEDLYPSDRAWLEDMEAAKTMAADLGKFSGTLAESAENLLAYLQSKTIRMRKNGAKTGLFWMCLVLGILYTLGGVITLLMPEVKTLPQKSFFYCLALKSVWASAVTTIESMAFINCSSMASASFPSVTKIGYWVFMDCKKLATLSFGSVITSINDAAFLTFPVS